MPGGIERKGVTGGGPQRQVPAGAVPGEHDPPGVHGVRAQRPHGERGQGVDGGGDVVERVRPTARRRGLLARVGAAVAAGRRLLAAAAVLHRRHGEAAAGEVRGERRDVPAVVACAPGAAVQHHDERRGPRGDTGRAARPVEVGDLVGQFTVGRGHVRGTAACAKADASSASARFAAASAGPGPAGAGARWAACSGVEAGIGYRFPSPASWPDGAPASPPASTTSAPDFAPASSSTSRSTSASTCAARSASANRV